MSAANTLQPMTLENGTHLSSDDVNAAAKSMNVYVGLKTIRQLEDFFGTQGTDANTLMAFVKESDSAMSSCFTSELYANFARLTHLRTEMLFSALRLAENESVSGRVKDIIEMEMAEHHAFEFSYITNRLEFETLNDALVGLAANDIFECVDAKVEEHILPSLPKQLPRSSIPNGPRKRKLH